MTAEERQEKLFREAGVQQNTYYPNKENVARYGEEIDRQFFAAERLEYLKQKVEKTKSEELAYQTAKIDEVVEKCQKDLHSILHSLKFDLERIYKQSGVFESVDVVKLSFDIASKYVDDYYYPKEKESYLDKAIAEVEAKKEREAREFKKRYGNLL